MRNAISALLCLLLLPGCAALQTLNSASTALEIYELTTPQIATGPGRRGVELIVEEPIASGSVATERIMIRPDALQAQYLPGARWPDPAPEMLQTLIVRSLLSSGALGSVGRRPVGAIGDYALLSELTDFQAEADAATDATVVRVHLIVRLVRERDARVVASRGFEAVQSASSATARDVVQAFDSAVAEMLAELVPWAVARIG